MLCFRKMALLVVRRVPEVVRVEVRTLATLVWDPGDDGGLRAHCSRDSSLGKHSGSWPNTCGQRCERKEGPVVLTRASQQGPLQREMPGMSRGYSRGLRRHPVPGMSGGATFRQRLGHLSKALSKERVPAGGGGLQQGPTRDPSHPQGRFPAPSQRNQSHPIYSKVFPPTVCVYWELGLQMGTSLLWVRRIKTSTPVRS